MAITSGRHFNRNHFNNRWGIEWQQQRTLLNANPIRMTKVRGEAKEDRRGRNILALVRLASQFVENTMPETQDAEMNADDHISDASQEEGDYHSFIDDSPVGSPTSGGQTTPRATHPEFATDPAAFALPSKRIGHEKFQVPSTPQFGVSSWPVQSSSALTREAAASNSIPTALQPQEGFSFSQEFQRTIPRLPQRRPDGDTNMELEENPWDDRPLTPPLVLGKRGNHNRPMLFLPDPDSPLNQSHNMATPVS